jgi:hypothetical protein
MDGFIPGALLSGTGQTLATGKKILILGLGEYVTAMSFFMPQQQT